jgi:hypothetical protein
LQPACRLTSKGDPLAPALVRYFSFFTIETNLLLALVLTASCLRPDADSWTLLKTWRLSAIFDSIVSVGSEMIRCVASPDFSISIID